MRYLLFAGSNYYPSGGYDDFCGDFETKEAAVAESANIARKCELYKGWWHVVDGETHTIVAEGACGRGAEPSDDLYTIHNVAKEPFRVRVAKK